MARMKFDKVRNRRFWETSTYDYLESVVNRIEFKFGRGTPLIAETWEIVEQNKGAITKLMEEQDHAR
jgi:hypothetical protein